MDAIDDDLEAVLDKAKRGDLKQDVLGVATGSTVRVRGREADVLGVVQVAKGPLQLDEHVVLDDLRHKGNVAIDKDDAVAGQVVDKDVGWQYFF